MTKKTRYNNTNNDKKTKTVTVTMTRTTPSSCTPSSAPAAEARGQAEVKALFASVVDDVLQVGTDLAAWCYNSRKLPGPSYVVPLWGLYGFWLGYGSFQE